MVRLYGQNVCAAGSGDGPAGRLVHPSAKNGWHFPFFFCMYSETILHPGHYVRLFSVGCGYAIKKRCRIAEYSRPGGEKKCRRMAAFVHLPNMFLHLLQASVHPATGSAAAAFGGLVAAQGDLGDGTHRLCIEQGYEMGRPSQINLTLTISGGKLTSGAIGGGAVVVTEGVIEA